MSDRIESIRALLAKDPDDLFLNYSLAMECAAAGRTDEALAAFARCSELDAGYIPAYVEAGKCARSAGRLDAAREQFRKALDLARSAGETHTADAIVQQIESLG